MIRKAITCKSTEPAPARRIDTTAAPYHQTTRPRTTCSTCLSYTNRHYVTLFTFRDDGRRVYEGQAERVFVMRAGRRFIRYEHNLYEVFEESGEHKARIRRGGGR